MTNFLGSALAAAISSAMAYWLWGHDQTAAIAYIVFVVLFAIYRAADHAESRARRNAA